MSDPINPNPAETNGASLANGEAPLTSDARPSVAAQLKAHPKVQQAIALAKAHPLGAVATVAAAAALVEVQFAIGILTGLGATALLAKKPGHEARDEVMTRGKQAIARAREEIAKRRQPKRSSRAGSAEASPPA